MLEKMKTEEPQLKFSYMFDTSLHQRERLDPANPQIEILLIQTPMMAKNYVNFHDVVFMDATFNTN